MSVTLVKSSEQILLKQIPSNSDIDGEAEEKRTSKVVGVYLWIGRISKLDIPNQLAKIQGVFIISFPGTKEDYIKYHENKKKFKCGYDPMNLVRFRNGTLEDCTLLETNVFKAGEIFEFWGDPIDELRGDHEYLIAKTYNIEGTFYQQFELKNFPFDCQDIMIHIQCRVGAKNTAFLPPLWGKGQVSLGGCNLVCNNLNDFAFSDYLCEYKCFSVTHVFWKVKVSRIWTMYFWKFILFMFFITLSSLIVYTLPFDNDNIIDKCSLIITLLLTVIAFQFVVADKMPELPYNTYLDWYMIVSFTFMCMNLLFIAIGNLIADRVGADEFREKEFQLLGFGMLGIFILVQIIFIIIGVILRKYEIKKLSMDQFDYAKHGYADKRKKRFVPLKPRGFRVHDKIGNFIPLKEWYHEFPEENFKN